MGEMARLRAMKEEENVFAQEIQRYSRQMGRYGLIFFMA